jgi:hypothetical protein
LKFEDFVLQTGCLSHIKTITTLELSDKIYQLLAHGWWFSQGTPASSTSKTGHHDIHVAEIGIKINQSIFPENLHIKLYCIVLIKYCRTD